MDVTRALRSRADSYTQKLPMWKQSLYAGLAFLGTTGLTGCFSSVRRVPKVQMQAPGTYRTADVETLEKAISDRDAAIKTLQASVLITATTGGEQTGKEKTYTSFRGYIFLQRPRDLRVILQVPVVGTRAMDMVSDGKTFTLLIPPHSKAYVGTDTVTKPSANGLENLRPAVFLDSLLVPGVSSDEYVVLTESTRVVEPAHGRKAAIEEPDYDLEIATPATPTSKMLRLERVVHISRVTLLPFEQDVYDEEGRVVTRATYENYAPVAPGEEPLPKTVTISRPLDQYSLKIDVTKLTLNATFEPDQFEMPKIPAAYKVQTMK